MSVGAYNQQRVYLTLPTVVVGNTPLNGITPHALKFCLTT